MMAGLIGGLGFDAPLILLALVALPVLWWLLRAIPPAPILRRFPGVALLIGLTDKETTTDRTPWWLLLLRALAIGAAIIGFAGPILAPQNAAPPGTGSSTTTQDMSDCASISRRTRTVSPRRNSPGTLASTGVTVRIIR